jgi:penicillin-binding protein 2
VKRRHRLREQNDPSTINKKRLKDRKRSHIFRMNVMYGLVFVSFTSLILRLGYLQIPHGAYFRNQATTTSLNKIPVLPARGWIYDRSGNLLAYDQPSYDVDITQLPHIHQDFEAISGQLAPVFHTTTSAVMSIISQNTAYASFTLFKKITPAQMAYVAEHQSQLPGVSITIGSERKYPEGDLAGHVLGYVSPIFAQDKDKYHKLGYLPSQHVGQGGIEYVYESLLKGKVGYQVVQTNSQGTPLKNLGFDPPQTPGDYLQLTLDGRVQAATQQAIVTAISKSKYKPNIEDAEAVMLNVKTGGVLALVSYPYLDPNWYINPEELVKHQNYMTSGAQVDHAIMSPHYPGSTVKPANLLTALKYNVITPTTSIIDHYTTYIGLSSIHDDGNHGYVDPVKAVTVSCDTFFYHVGLMFGQWLGSNASNGGHPAGGISVQTWRDTDFAKGIAMLFQGEWSFGLGQPTNIDLPGEVTGNFWIEKNYNQKSIEVPFKLSDVQQQLKKTGLYVNYGSPMDLAFGAIGQSQQFTPIELAQYVATIANNGIKLQPHLLKAIVPSDMQSHLSPDTKPIKVFQPTIQADLHINPTYLKLAQQGMYGVVNSPLGTAYYPFLGSPYKVAGKTGTAQIFMHGRKEYNSVFIAYAPYNHPEVAVAVMVPGGGYGSETAAPIARQMLDAYFKEHHAAFFPKSQWTNSEIPANWKTSSAYTLPEKSH